MVKKKDWLTVMDNLRDVFTDLPTPRQISIPVSGGLPIDKAVEVVSRQMEISGNRERTIRDYRIHVRKFAKLTGLTYLHEINTEKIYEWLSKMDVGNQTKLTRLKCLKAFLSRCFDNGWIETKERYWKNIKVKVDKNVPKWTTEEDILLLLSVLDLNDFVQLRDATAALLMYKTGIRINTVVQLENKHIDFDNKLLRLDGAIMKNHDTLILPFDDTLHRLLSVLVKHNDVIRHVKRKQNNYVFITRFGNITSSGPTNNIISKRLTTYSKIYGVKNLNGHALRRGFARSLLDKGAHVFEISKALGHCNLAVTTQYLNIDKEEVAENLRKYL